MNKFTYSLLPLIFVCLASTFSVHAQLTTGWQIYDSVKMDLSRGTITKKYLPFDVPFYLYGDADFGDSTKIEFIRLRIIDSKYQACCLPEQYLSDPSKLPSSCNCDCRSLTEQRLDFFKTVQKYKRDEPLVNQEVLQILKLMRTDIGKDLDGLKVLVKDSMPGLAKNLKELRDLKDPLVTKFITSTEYPITKAQALRESFSNFFPKDCHRREKLKALSKSKNLSKTLSDELRHLNEWPALDCNAIDKKFALLQADERQIRTAISNLHSQVISKRAKVDMHISRRLADSAYYARFSQLYSKEIQNLTIEEIREKIDTDTKKLCPNCLDDFRQCRDICSWQRDHVMGNGKVFFLSMPPLQANHSYIFFFDITRLIRNKEKKILEKVVTRKIVDAVSGDIDDHVNVLTRMNYNIDEMRQDILVSATEPDPKLNIIEPAIKEFFQQEYGPDLKNYFDKIPPVNDKYTYRRLLNEMITHKLYKNLLDTTYALYREHIRVYDTLKVKFVINKKNLDKYRQNFFNANEMKRYALLDMLYRIVRSDSLGRIMNFYLPYRNIGKEVPTGLIPHSNLQMVSLRDLEQVNDFDVKTVDNYILNLQRYNLYLDSVQKCINDDLIRGDGQLRNKLFGVGGSEDLLPPRNRGVGARKVLEDLNSLSLTINNHQNDVRRFINIYRNYKENTTAMNDQAAKLVDSLLHNNRSIQLAVARKTGGISSASFKTRTTWYVTADVGVAYIPFGSAGHSEVTPYFGANFNLHPVNREAHYGLFAGENKKKRLMYKGTWVNPFTQQFHNPADYVHSWRNKLWKASSFVLGVTTSDLKVEGIRDNLIGSTKLNLLTGYGLRLSDAGRFSIGAIWVRKVDPNPLITTTTVTPYLYFSLSFDVDVLNALGAVGKLLSPKSPQ